MPHEEEEERKYAVVFDPTSLEQRELLASTAYSRTLVISAAREAELDAGEPEPKYALSWSMLPPARQEPYRAAVEALVSLFVPSRQS